MCPLERASGCAASQKTAACVWAGSCLSASAVRCARTPPDRRASSESPCCTVLGSCVPPAHLTECHRSTHISDASTSCLLLQSFVSDLSRLTQGHSTMKCYGLGLGLVALTEHFRRLDAVSLMSAYQRSATRVALASLYGGRRCPASCTSIDRTMQVILLGLVKRLVWAVAQSAQ